MSETKLERWPRLSRWLLLFAVAVNLYLLGAAAVLQVVQYPQLGEVGAAALPALYTSLTGRLGGVFILPEFLAFLAVLPLLRVRPAGTPAWAVGGCIFLGIAYFGVTFGWHLPAHALIARGDVSAPVMQRLLLSHAIRTATLALKSGLLLWMVAAVLKRSR